MRPFQARGTVTEREVLSTDHVPDLFNRHILIGSPRLGIGVGGDNCADFLLLALAARKLGQRALDAGEIYSLETLANLSCDAGKERDLALRLAEQNYQGKRDESARNTLARARAP